MRLAVALAVLTLILAGPAASADRYGNQKVVYHVSVDGGEGAKAYLQALRNIQNHIDAVGVRNIDVKVVMHGDGLNLLRDATTNLRLQGEVVNLRNQKVSFLVCRNTLTQRKIDPNKDLFEVDAEDIVPSGVAELSHLQRQGYTYIRP